ncbi:DUF421 domain-containing protein [Caldalkalibacillus salinus]|uniref:DUF421 domain-containing protein n=1 Tax=Caldalkalibacillus salinus TaxID=2803787 RepID=UPI00192437A4
MDMIFEMIVLFLRIVTILPLLLFVTLMMGKRSIAELPVFDFLVVITLGSVVGADLADPTIEHLHTAVAVVTIGFIQIIVSKLKLSHRKFGRLITFEPTIVVHNGVFLNQNINQIKYSVDNILNLLRQKGVFDVSEVALAIVEANGELTVHKKEQYSSVTIEDLGLSKTSKGIAYPVIIEGFVYDQVLEKLNLNRDWIDQKLKAKNIDLQSVFFASVDKDHHLHVSVNQDEHSPSSTAPPIMN